MTRTHRGSTPPWWMCGSNPRCERDPRCARTPPPRGCSRRGRAFATCHRRRCAPSGVCSTSPKRVQVFVAGFWFWRSRDIEARRPALFQRAECVATPAHTPRATMPMIARHGLVAPAATVVSDSRARPARRVSAMKSSTGVHVPRRRSRAYLLCVVTGAPRPALASPRGSRVVRSAAAADALHADDPSEDRRDGGPRCKTGNCACMMCACIGTITTDSQARCAD